MTSVHLGLLVVCLAAAPGESPRVAQLIARLGSDDFDERERATQALAAVGWPALAALRRAAEAHPDVEVRQRAAKLVEALDPPDPDASAFAERLQALHKTIAETTFARPSPRRLAELALRGLYGGQGEDLPANLAARLKKETASDAELRAVLHDGYRQLAARCELDVGLAVSESVSFTLRALDPHGRVGPSNFVCDLGGRGRVGIGVELRLDPKTREPRVVTPLKDGPAYNAGLRAGDVITHVRRPTESGPNNRAGGFETRLTAGEALEQVEAWLAGANGTKVVLTVRRDGADAPRLIGVVRGPAARETVLGWRRKKDDSWDYLADPEQKLGYVRLTTFTSTTGKQLGAILGELEKQGARGVVIDLRGCPGGLLDGAVAAAGRFLERGLVVRVRPGKGDDYDATVSGGKPRCTLPVVCLVNEETASSAELFAAALQDHRRAAVVGERSRGKASVQNILHIDGSELTLTTAVFLRPSGKKLDRIALPGHDADEWGVTPDVGNAVRLSPEEKDALRAHLERRAIIPHRDVPVKEPAFEDRQLKRALEVLARGK